MRFRRALILIPAEGCGYIISILTVKFALGSALAAAPVLGRILRALLGGYLLIMAWKLWRKGETKMLQEKTLVTSGQVFRTTLLNPKALIISLGIIPFQNPLFWLYLIGFSSVTAAVATGWIAFGATMGSVAAAKG